MSNESITTAALALAPKQRAELAERLLESLDLPAEQGVEGAWAEEVERRIDAFDQGNEQGIPAEQALRDARAKLQ